MLSRSSHRDTRVSCAPAPRPRNLRPSATFSATLMSARSGRWKTVAMRRRSASAWRRVGRSGRESAPRPGWVARAARRRAGASTPAPVRADHRQDLARRHAERRQSRTRRGSVGDPHAAPARTTAGALTSAGRGSILGGSRTPSAGRARCRGSRRRAAGPRTSRSKSSLRRRARRVEARGARTTPCRIRLADDASAHQVHVVGGVRRAAILADQPDVLRADEERRWGCPAGGRYERVGEFTASASARAREIWMRSGVAFTTVPCSTLRSPMMRATRSDAGCHGARRAARTG